MTSIEIVFEKLEDVRIKEEICDENSGADTCRSWKCGEILLDDVDDNFTLVCALCFQQYNGLHSFGAHIREKHMTSRPCFGVSKTEGDLDPFAAISHSSVVDATRVGTIPDTKELSGNPINCENHSDVVFEDIELLEISNESSSDEKLTSVKEKVLGKRKNCSREVCVHCDRKYMSRRTLLAHIKKVHGGEDKSNNFVDSDSRSKVTVIASTTTSVTCKYCDVKFENHTKLKDHVRSHTGPKRFVCPYCPKQFSSSYGRNSHVNTHTGERPFKCTHCPKGFADATNLEMHIRMHLRIMKYSCDYCDKRFVQSTEKVLHERTHTGEKPYQCEECGRRFNSHVKLSEHWKRHKNIRNYKCEVCEKAFYNSSLRKDHMTTHTSEKPFHCNVCGQNFPRKKSLRVHQQLHSGVKKYACDACGKTFAQFAGLYSHKKSHSEAKTS